MGIMLVYDISNPKSFDNIAKWLRNIDEVSISFFSFCFNAMKRMDIQSKHVQSQGKKHQLALPKKCKVDILTS